MSEIPHPPDKSVDGGPWFDAEVHPHGPQLRSYLRGMFPSVRDVDDVIQESYLRILKARAAQPVRSAKALLFKIARHLALDEIRRAKRSPIVLVSDFESLDVIEDRPTGWREISLEEKIEALADAIAALPARRRSIIILRKFHQLPQAEVARQLNISERTVENQLYRGLKQCEAALRRRGISSLHGDEKA